MVNYEVRLIELALIRAADFERPLEADHATNLARDIQEHDLHQAIGVKYSPPGYVRAWGQHRCEAFRILNRTHIPAIVVPEDADELLYSLTENNLRRDESMEAMVKRITALARRQNIPFQDAALQGNIKPSRFSRCKTIVRKLSPEARELAAAHDLGMSDLYIIATRGLSPEIQLEAIQARINGLSRDELVTWFNSRLGETASTKSVAKRHTHKLEFSDLNADVQMRLPAEFDTQFIAALIKQLRTQLRTLRQQSRPNRRSSRRQA